MTPRQTRHVFPGTPFPGIPHTPLGTTDFFRADHAAVFLTLGLCQSQGTAAATQVQARKETLTSGFEKNHLSIGSKSSFWFARIITD